MKEAEVKKHIKNMLRKYDVWFFMPFGYNIGRAGIPDFICCIKGYLLAIEAKGESGEVTKLQRIEQETIIKAGGVALVVNEYMLEELEKVVESMTKLKGLEIENTLNELAVKVH